MTVEAIMEEGAMSSLVKLSPTETKRARRARYPIFRDNSGDIDRFSYLFDEIPFGLESVGIAGDRLAAYAARRETMKSELCGTYDVFYHGEKIDWGALEGWEVFSTKRPRDTGKVFIGRGHNTNALEGRLWFFPSEENEDFLEDEENEEFPEDEESEEFTEDEENEEFTEDEENEEFPQEDEENEDFQEDEENEDFQEDYDEMEEEGEESNETSTLNSEIRERFDQICTFLHFDERRFVLSEDYESASWYGSGCGFDFGLVGSYHSNRNNDAENSVTLFRASESMAFARGEKQEFVSLEDPSNHGIECGRRCLGLDDDSQRVRVIETMKAYRGSWMSKLSVSGITLPEELVPLIWQFWQTAPPPFIFVDRGDLLLLARCKETFPDPDGCFDVVATREHLVLARPAD